MVDWNKDLASPRGLFILEKVMIKVIYFLVVLNLALLGYRLYQAQDSRQTTDTEEGFGYHVDIELDEFSLAGAAMHTSLLYGDNVSE